MSWFNKIGPHIKDNAIKYISSSVILIIVAGGTWVFNTFKTGYELEKKKEATVLVKSIIQDLINDREEMNVFVYQVLSSDTAKAYKEQAIIESSKATAELFKGDSINLRVELRLYMDLRESQSVASELGKMYKNYNRLPFIVDSIMEYNRRRTPNMISL